MIFSLVLRDEAGASESLPEIVARCKVAFEADPDVLNRFEIALARAGYSPVHDDEYTLLKLRVVDGALYAVRDDFPRIVPSSFIAGLPVGVEAIRYEINIEAFIHLHLALEPNEALNFLE